MRTTYTPLAIAAGVGLLALVGVAFAARKSLNSSLSSIGSGRAASSMATPRIGNYGQNNSLQKVEVVAALTLRAPDLTAVLRGDIYRVKLTN